MAIYQNHPYYFHVFITITVISDYYPHLMRDVSELCTRCAFNTLEGCSVAHSMEKAVVAYAQGHAV